MPHESIGSVNTGDMPNDRAWIVAALEWAAEYLKMVVEVPHGCKIEIIWSEHELGSYPSLGVTWEDPMSPPYGLLSRLEFALRRFDDAIDWSVLEPQATLDALDEHFGTEDGDASDLYT